MNAEILVQLIWVKWLLITIMLAFVTIAGLLVVGARKTFRTLDTKTNERPFYDMAQDLIQKAEYAQARTLAEARISAYPGDPHAYWCHATACYRLGDNTTALSSLRKINELQPDWSDKFVTPFIESIESKGKAKSKSAISGGASKRNSKGSTTKRGASSARKKTTRKPTS